MNIIINYENGNFKIYSDVKYAEKDGYVLELRFSKTKKVFLELLSVDEQELVKSVYCDGQLLYTCYDDDFITAYRKWKESDLL